MKIISLILCALVVAGSASGQTTHTAASTSRADVQAAYDLCSAGDTLAIPAGGPTAWTTTFKPTLAITIQGAGIGNTIITDAVSGSGINEAIIAWTIPTNGTARLTGIEFRDGGKASSGGFGAIQVYGSTQNFRMDHCKTLNLNNRHIYIWSDVYGVIDNCVCDSSGLRAHIFAFEQSDAYGRINGNGNWENAVGWGGARFMYVEDCTLTGENTLNINDGFGGGKYVFRRNTVHQRGFGHHGTESTQQYRGARAAEIYQNTSDRSGSAVDTWMDVRDGNALVWGNTITGSFNSITKFNSYRSFLGFQPWNSADGTKAWDGNDLTDGAGTPGGAGDGVFESGTCNAANTANLTDTAGLTVSQSGTTLTASGAIFTSAMVGKSVYFVPQYPASSTSRVITAFTDSTHVTVAVNATVAAKPFIIGEMSALTDTTKSWSPTNKWAGYALRHTYSGTASSGSTSTLTVSGAGWVTDQWAGYEITKTSDNSKGAVTSNTSDTLTLSTGSYRPNFTGGGAFVLSLSAQIESSTSTSVTIFNQGSYITNYTFCNGMEYEIRRCDWHLDQPGRGLSDALSSQSISGMNHQDLNQQAESSYVFNNLHNGSSSVVVSNGGYATIVENRDYYNQPASFTGATGVGVGTLASRPSSGLTAGVGWWATDQGEWDSTNGATPDGQLYVATDATTWALYYTPYTYPHPLTSGIGDTIAPTVTSAIIDVTGTTLTISYSEPVTGVSAADYALNSGSLSSASGSGSVWTMTISPAVLPGATRTLNYTAGGTVDTSSNPLASFSGRSVTNSSTYVPTGPALPARRASISASAGAVSR